MTDYTLAAILARHTKMTTKGYYNCCFCGFKWPCDAVRLAEGYERRIEQHRGALGYSVSCAIPDDPTIKNGIAEALHKQVEQLEARVAGLEHDKMIWENACHREEARVRELTDELSGADAAAKQWESNARYADAQHDKALEALTAARAEGDRLREALTEIANVRSPIYDNEEQIMRRIARKTLATQPGVKP